MSNDIIVLVGRTRHVGLEGRVVRPRHSGVEAILENGERVNLENHQFDYFSELFSSQNKESGVNKEE